MKLIMMVTRGLMTGLVTGRVLNSTTPSPFPTLAPEGHGAGEETRCAEPGACAPGEPPHAPTTPERPHCHMSTHC